MCFVSLWISWAYLRSATIAKTQTLKGHIPGEGWHLHLNQVCCTLRQPQAMPRGSPGGRSVLWGSLLPPLLVRLCGWGFSAVIFTPESFPELPIPPCWLSTFLPQAPQPARSLRLPASSHPFSHLMLAARPVGGTMFFAKIKKNFFSSLSDSRKFWAWKPAIGVRAGRQTIEGGLKAADLELSSQPFTKPASPLGSCCGPLRSSGPSLSLGFSSAKWRASQSLLPAAGRAKGACGQKAPWKVPWVFYL